MKNRRRSRRGFTLIEILLVLTIIGMLAGVTIFAIGGIGKRARVDTTKAILETVANALDTYQLHVGHYPSEEEGNLDALRVRPAFDTDQLADKWSGPYLKKAPVDAWSNPLSYEIRVATTTDSTEPPYRLWSNGPDLMSDTEDDINYWSEDESGTF
ncbi:MAG: type II secretion system major pseudopilin GspG [Planctomycetes bacterium]|nr:type II secretion system major pseudopilin GspG [Planctomycetota bacterium]